MSQTGLLSVLWRKIGNTSPSKIQVRFTFLSLLERAVKSKCEKQTSLLQVSGRSRCLSQNCTLFGGPGGLWVETSSCWLVEEATLCLPCTSTEEEPESCWRPCNVTSSWTSRCHRPNSDSSSCSCHQTADVLCVTWFAAHVFVYTSHDSGEKKKHQTALFVIARSPVDGRLFLAYPHDSGALSQSFDKLQLLDDGGSDLVSVRKMLKLNHVCLVRFKRGQWCF